jgi:Domain of unknown function (DUF4440)
MQQPHDIEAWIRAYDQLWLDSKFDGLQEFLAENVAFVAPNGTRISGATAAIESYREFLKFAQVLSYATSGYQFTSAPGIVVAEYTWHMDWQAQGATHSDSGREILVIQDSGAGLRILWRTQIPLAPPASS